MASQTGSVASGEYSFFFSPYTTTTECVACKKSVFTEGRAIRKASPFVAYFGERTVNMHKICLSLFLKLKSKGISIPFNDNGDVVKEAIDLDGNVVDLGKNCRYYEAFKYVFSENPQVSQKIELVIQHHCRGQTRGFGSLVGGFNRTEDGPISRLSDYEKCFDVYIKPNES